MTVCFVLQVLKTVHNEETLALNNRDSRKEAIERNTPSPQIGEAGYWHKLSPMERSVSLLRKTRTSM